MAAPERFHMMALESIKVEEELDPVKMIQNHCDEVTPQIPSLVVKRENLPNENFIDRDEIPHQFECKEEYITQDLVKVNKFPLQTYAESEDTSKNIAYNLFDVSEFKREGVTTDLVSRVNDLNSRDAESGSIKGKIGTDIVVKLNSNNFSCDVEGLKCEDGRWSTGLLPKHPEEETTMDLVRRLDVPRVVESDSVHGRIVTDGGYKLKGDDFSSDVEGLKCEEDRWSIGLVSKREEEEITTDLVCRVNVVSESIKKEVTTDLVSYVNDFNSRDVESGHRHGRVVTDLEGNLKSQKFFSDVEGLKWEGERWMTDLVPKRENEEMTNYLVRRVDVVSESSKEVPSDLVRRVKKTEFGRYVDDMATDLISTVKSPPNFRWNDVSKLEIKDSTTDLVGTVNDRKPINYDVSQCEKEKITTDLICRVNRFNYSSSAVIKYEEDSIHDAIANVKGEEHHSKLVKDVMSISTSPVQLNEKFLSTTDSGTDFERNGGVRTFIGASSANNKIRKNDNFVDKSLMLSDVSVRLVDLFSSDMQRLGKGHSADRNCSCIYCRGEYKYTQPRSELNEDCDRQVARASLYKRRGRENQPIRPKRSNSGYPKIKGPFTCNHCQREFKQSCLLQRHLTTHNNERPFKCNRCSKTYKCSKALHYHLTKHTEKGQHKCQECSARFEDSSVLRSHERYHRKEYKCTLCSAIFKESCHLTNHMRRHTGEKPFECKQCHATFGQAAGLSKHMMTHSFERPHKCKLCPAAFKRSDKLIVHLKVHSDETSVECTVCQAKFKYKSYLKQHMRTHTGERPYSCDQCPATFKSTSERSVHFRAKHSDERSYSCNYCEAKFKNRVTLVNHLQDHSKDKPFECKVCGKRFKQKSQLTVHSVIHKSEKPFKCSKCPAEFKLKSTLKLHSKIHDFVKLYECAQCFATFKHRFSLKSHMATHTDEKPFKCEQCPARFKHKSALPIHRRIHNGETPFQCDQCQAQFRQSSGLTAHKTVHHTSEKLFECAHCSAKFKMKSEVKSHLKHKHSIIV